jgi:hypothetical protein
MLRRGVPVVASLSSRTGAALACICSIRSNLFLDLLHMMEVISEGAVNISEGNSGICETISSEVMALVLEPDDDVLYSHVVAGGS